MAAARTIDPDAQINVVASFQDVEDYFRWLSTPKTWLAYDCETTGLLMSSGRDKMRLFQLGDDKTAWVFRSDRWLGVLVDTFSQYKGRIVGHNLSFDVHAYEVATGEKFPWSQGYDTRIMSHILAPNKSTALKSVTSRFLGADARRMQGVLDVAMQKNGWGWADIPYDFDLYTGYCVPTTTEILTRYGWKSVNEVNLQDKTLGIDKDGLLKWTPITDVNTFFDKELVTIGGKQKEYVCTPNHRWVFKSATNRETPFWVEPLVVEKSPGVLHRRTNHELVLTAYAEGGDSSLTPSEASILAWVLADGHVRWQRPRSSPCPRIYQHQKKFATAIRQLLISESAYVSEVTDPETQVIGFHVNATYFYHLWLKARLWDQSLSSLVLTLSQDARRSWFYTWYCAEGVLGDYFICQNPGEKKDAIALTVLLEGFIPSSQKRGINIGTKGVSGQDGHLVPKPAGFGDVWCPTTELGTWVARDEQGNIFLTGNSGLDCVLTTMLAQENWPKIDSEFREVYELEMQVARVCNGIERRGVAIDVPYVERMYSQTTEYCQQLEEYCLSEWGIRPSENEQIARKLRSLGVPMEVLTEKGNISTDKTALGRASHPLADCVLEFRAKSKIANTYFKNFLEKNQNGRLHASINTLAARTGRQSINNPALQTIPRGSVVRDCFLPNEGEDFWSVDYSGIEARVFSHFAREEGLIQAFKDGLDPHRYTAQKVYHVDEPTREQRQVCKNATFAMLFGASAEKVGVTANISEREAQEFLDFYKKAFPGVPVFMDSVIAVAEQRFRSEGVGYVKTPIGRLEVCDTGKAYTLINALIQGTAADIMKIAMVNVDNSGFGNNMLLPVHDEILYSLPTGTEVQQIVDCMEDYTSYLVPLTCKSSGPWIRWGDKARAGD